MNFVKKIKEVLIFIKGCCFGLFFLIMGLLIIYTIITDGISSREFIKNATVVEAVVSKVVTRHEDYKKERVSKDVYISYEFDGKFYSNIRLYEGNGLLYEGKRITILCNPDAPDKIMWETGKNTGSWFGIIGGIVFAIFGVLLVAGNFKVEKRRRLMKDGVIVTGVIETIKREEKNSVNGKYPWVILCKYEEVFDNKTYCFKSEHFWGGYSRPYV